MTVFRKKALKQIRKIHELSQRLNGRTKSRHEKKLLSLMREHLDEIESLYKLKKSHYLIEIGDLIILCFEMLIENKCSMDKTIELCIRRYDKKITQLLKK
jgi:hypothetical protein